MSRRLLGDFGRNMGDPELGAALAGALVADTPSRTSGRGRVVTELWPFFYARAERDDAAAQVLAWKERATRIMSVDAPTRHGLALELLARRYLNPPNLDLRWLTETIGRGSFVSAVSLITAPSRAPAEWLWPLDVALCGDAHSQALRGTLERLHWHRFVTVVAAEQATTPIELLLLPASLRESLAQMLLHPRLPRVQAVLVLGGISDAKTPVAMAELLRARTDADAVFVANVTPHEREVFLDGMLVELSHDVDLDVAIAQACRTHAAGPPLCVAAAGALRRAHLSTWARSVATRLARSPELELDISPRTSGGAAPDVGRELLQRLPTAPFDSELAAAREIADLGHETRAKPPSPTRRERFVQAELFDGPDADAHRVSEAPLAPRTYRLDVWIGAPEEGAVVAPAPFPEDDLPPSEEGHDLTIVLTTSVAGRAPQVEHVMLAASGPTERVHFELAVPEGIRQIEARIVVLHGNRVLQTLLFSAAAGDQPAAPLLLSIEAIVRRDLAAAAVRRDFDVALITNQLAGRSTVSIFAGDRASLVPTSDQIAQLTKEVADALEQATNKDKKYGKPGSKGTSDLLAALARKGVLLRDALLEMPGVRDDLALAQRIQIVVARPDDATLPLEICYDGAAPGVGAKTCPNWKSALADGKCQPTCPTDRSTVVCPVAFWGMQRTIERHAYSKPTAKDIGAAAYALQTEPSDGRSRLPIANGSLCAAAEAARTVDADSVDEAFATAGNVAHPEREAKNWELWKAAITGNPSLLVLLSHTDDDGNGTRQLVIDKSERLYISSIDPTYVGTGGGPGPIVLLLGCTTAITELAFQSFVERFRLGGAAIVVGTLCEILGRHAAPIAKQLITEIGRAAKQPEGTPLGDLVPVLRRQLLADGYPIVLAVAVYGDADWRI